MEKLENVEPIILFDVWAGEKAKKDGFVPSYENTRDSVHDFIDGTLSEDTYNFIVDNIALFKVDTSDFKNAKSYELVVDQEGYPHVIFFF